MDTGEMFKELLFFDQGVDKFKSLLRSEELIIKGVASSGIRFFIENANWENGSLKSEVKCPENLPVGEKVSLLVWTPNSALFLIGKIQEKKEKIWVFSIDSKCFVPVVENKFELVFTNSGAPQFILMNLDGQITGGRFKISKIGSGSIEFEVPLSANLGVKKGSEIRGRVVVPGYVDEVVSVKVRVVKEVPDVQRNIEGEFQELNQIQKVRLLLMAFVIDQKI